MDTPPPACSSPDLTGQGERGLRGSAGLGVAPCCDQAPYPLKTYFHSQPYRGGPRSRTAVRLPQSPLADPNGFHTRAPGAQSILGREGFSRSLRYGLWPGTWPPLNPTQWSVPRGCRRRLCPPLYI